MRKLYFLFAVLFIVSGKAQIINFPDANFKAKLLTASTNNLIAINASGASIRIDGNNDSEIDVNEALSVYELSVINLQSPQIASLTGIEMFANLKRLNCGYNVITALDLSDLTNLEMVSCGDNLISSINVSGLTHLKHLSLAGNRIESLSAINYQGSDNIDYINLRGNLLSGAIDISIFHQLKRCNFDYNEITSINLNGLSQLEQLDISNNLLTTVDLSGLNNFKYLNASDNIITSLDVSQNPLLDHLYLKNNLLTTLDLSNNHQFFYLNIRNNSLTSLFIKNGRNNTIELHSNPTLAYICADESELSNIMLYYNVMTEVNSYCSFVPGGTYYEITGTSRFDFNNSGCDTADILFPNAKFSITNGVNSGNLIANASGNYSLPVTAVAS